MKPEPLTAEEIELAWVRVGDGGEGYCDWVVPTERYLKTIDVLTDERDENERILLLLRRQRNEAEVEVDRLREGLRFIAEPDTLLDANEDAFNEHAARRMQEQARYLLGE